MILKIQRCNTTQEVSMYTKDLSFLKTVQPQAHPALDSMLGEHKVIFVSASQRDDVLTIHRKVETRRW